MEKTNALRTGLAKALNTEAATLGLRLALNMELPSGEIPDWVELLPAGHIVTGRDGRAWRNSNPQGVVDQFVNRNVDLVTTGNMPANTVPPMARTHQPPAGSRNWWFGTVPYGAAWNGPKGPSPSFSARNTAISPPCFCLPAMKTRLPGFPARA